MGVKGIITEIQRFSLNDGPGIRTTVFFKGCNMRCAWCHNPETINPDPEIMFTELNCIGCLKCVGVCHSGAQTVISGEQAEICNSQTEKTGLHAFDRDKCTGCGKCAEICYAEAMTVSGHEMSVAEIMREVEQDRIYYSRSGGGITLSGGEPSCQPAFARELMIACRERHIQTGLETNMLAPYEELAPLLELTDILMADIKLIDDDAHREWTGAGNKRILENLRRACGNVRGGKVCEGGSAVCDAGRGGDKGDELGATISGVSGAGKSGLKVIIRTPLVPGITDSDENIAGIAEFISGLGGVLYYELLNYNPLGDVKYRGLGMGNRFASQKPLGAARLEALKKVAEGSGVPVRVG